jgi:hypothetical protein
MPRAFRCVFYRGLEMLSYEVDGPTLTLRASRILTLDEREMMLNAARADPAVPNDALLLIDARDIDVAMSESTMAERLRVLVGLLGPKLGRVCAVIVPPRLAPQFRLFQTAGNGMGLQIELFSDEPSARQWLSAHR